MQLLLIFLLQRIIIKGWGRSHWEIFRLRRVILLKWGCCLWKLVPRVLNSRWFRLLPNWIQWWLCPTLRLFKRLSNNLCILIWWWDSTSWMTSLILFWLFKSLFHDSLHLISGFSARLFNLPFKFTLHCFLLQYELFSQVIDLLLE